MTAFLSELGGKLADRWLAMLVFPGMLWVATFVLADHLGQTDALDVNSLPAWLDRLGSRPAAHAPGTVVLAALGSVIASAGLGLIASALGAVVERIWSARGLLPPASWMLERRRQRWEQARENLRAAIREAAELAAISTAPSFERRKSHRRILRLQRRRRRAGDRRPERPTRIGDRFVRTADRAMQLHGVRSFDLVWPRLWSVLPDSMRAEIAAARDTHSSSARLFAWALLYLIIAPIWWPAALIAAGIAATGALRAGPSADRLADLVETAMDLHLRDLGSQLGLSSSTARGKIGKAVVDTLRTPLRPSP